MIDFDQLKRDREAGTKGPWVVALDGDMQHIVTPDADPICSMGAIVCQEQEADARRISRVPGLEALALAGRELAGVCCDDIGWWLSGAASDPNVCDEMKKSIDNFFNALAAWDKAIKGETND